MDRGADGHEDIETVGDTPEQKHHRDRQVQSVVAVETCLTARGHKRGPTALCLLTIAPSEFEEIVAWGARRKTLRNYRASGI